MTAIKHYKPWSEADDQTLIELWGVHAPSYIAKKIGRTPEAVKTRSKVLKLGCYLKNSEYLYMKQVTDIMGVDSHVPARTWIPKYKLPVKNIKIGKIKRKIIRVDKLLKWMKENPEAYDARKIEQYALGIEPEWLKEKRKLDQSQNVKPSGKKYTDAEDSAIVIGLKRNLTYRQIGEQINRSAASVQCRAYRLDVWGTGKLKKGAGQ